MDTKQAVNTHIRWMIRRDMPAVLGIENKSFEFAWTEDDFIRCLRQRNCIAMLGKLLGKLSHERRNRIMLEVRETNLEAQLFFKSVGFKAISVLRDFYEDTVEDAYLMQFRYQASVEELAQPHNRITRMAG